VAMSARLETLRFIPRPGDGWETPPLPFGDLFTALQGANGSGKTPVMKGLMQALGHEMDLPPEIVQRCAAVELQLLLDGRSVTLTRYLGPSFHMQAKDGDKTQEFLNQAEYGKWFTQIIGGELRTVTSKQETEAPLYANVIIPAFCVDQDHGWTVDYHTPPHRNFIKNQRQEVVRYLMGVPAKHPFRAKAEFEEAKRDQDLVEKNLELQRYAVERLRTSNDLRDDEEQALLARRAILESELTASAQAVEAVREITSFYERDIATLEAQRDTLRASVTGLDRQRGQLRLVLSELDGEMEILGANVQATDLLRQFCGREGCEMFANSEQSFGRSLLYLKDQTKDLQASSDEMRRDAAEIGERIVAIEQSIAARKAARASALADSPQAQLMTRLDALTAEVVAIRLRLALLQQYVTERGKFERLLDRRSAVLATVHELRPRAAGKSDTNIIADLRQQLSDSLQQWIETLNTENTKTASFDEDFVILIDGARFNATSHHSGSTRARIVLAFHAALLEVGLMRGGHHPGWLIFDAPKQHELVQKDFDAYAERLKVISVKYPGRMQVIFSVADLKTQIEVTDERWDPTYTIDGKPRFLGSVVRPGPTGG
jgi:hypothetical protein